MGTFVISKRLNDYYKFEFVSRKGKTIFTSTDYELRFECEEAVEFFKAAVDSCSFLKFKTAKGKNFFKLMQEEKIIAISRKYSTPLMMQKGIDEICRTATQSEVLDFSGGDIFSDI